MSRPKRPSPSTVTAWQNRRLGLFIHWGLYSLLGGVWQGKEISGYNEQIQAHARIPRDAYATLARDFNPILWNPDEVVALAKAAGMKFVVITAKHHDGFSLFDSAHSDFNVVTATPYGIDIIEGLSQACKRGGLGFGVYFSTIDWHFKGGTGIDFHPTEGIRNDNEIPEAHADFSAAQLTELVTKYGPISEVWFDMGSPTPEQSELFADTVHRHQPEAMVSGRVFNYQGDFVVMGDNEIPPYQLEEAWQSPASIYHETWGYRSWQKRNDLAGKVAEHLQNLVRVISRGGNYLLNIGPRGDGSIVEFEEDVLLGIGQWLEAHQEAIEGTSPQPFRHLEFGAATACKNKLFLFILSWPESGELILPGLINQIASAYWIRSPGNQLTVRATDGATVIEIDHAIPSDPVPVIVVELDGPVAVRSTCIPPNGDGVWVLRPDNADSFSHLNGRGYYDPPKLYKLRWSLGPLAPGPYQVELNVLEFHDDTDVQVQIGGYVSIINLFKGLNLVWSFEPEGDDEIEVFITPVPPIEKGVGLNLTLNSITVTPLQ